MPLPTHVNPVDFLHENRKDALVKLEELKAKRAGIPAARKKPCVFLAFTSVAAPRKDKAGKPEFPEPEVTVKAFNLSGGHKKKSSIQNMMRQGKFPVGYEFPTDEQNAAVKAQAKQMEGTLNRSLVAQLMDTDPYYEVRKYIDRQVHILLTDWGKGDADEAVSGLSARVTELKEQRDAQAKEIEKLKAELSDNGVPKKTKKATKTKKTKEDIKKELASDEEAQL